jgi:hypothetical protein
MKNRLTILAMISVIIISCEKDDWDYRNKYTGDYNFGILYAYTTFEGDYMYDGHFVKHDTTYFFNGSVKKSLLNPNEVKIDWGTKVLSIEGNNVNQQKTQLRIDSDGTLTCPYISEGFNQPAYIHADTIKFTFSTGNGMAHQLYSLWNVTGLKR